MWSMGCAVSSFSESWNRAASEEDYCWAEIAGIASRSHISEEV